MDTTILLLEIVLFFFITFIALSYFNKYVKRNNKKLPPGPTGIPLLGYLPFLGDLPFKTFKQLSQKYGNVLGIYMGRSFAVILNDYESVKDAFSNPVILDRPLKFFDFHPGGLGFVSTNGDAWVEERRYVMKIIKDIGMGKSRWEEDLEAEIEDFLTNLSHLHGKPTDIRDLLSHSISNNMTSLVLGKRLPLHDPHTKTINNAVNALSALGQSGLVLFFPDLMKFLARAGLSKLSVQYYSMKKLNDFMRNEVSSRKNTFETTDETVFIDGYLRQMKSLKEKNIKSCFTEENLTANAQALIQAGSETTRTSLLWLFFAMASNLEVQKKCQQEIDSVLGTDGKCQWSNAKNLPFTYATVMEGQRWRTVGPINLARMANEDTTIGDFHIPKGTLIFANMWALHNDTKYWQDPENFMPERFLSKDGTLNKTKPDSYIPFSMVNNLIANAQALIHAGSETTRTSLLWLFISLASFPDIQKKCHNEIQGVLGKDGKCRWSDAKNLPYTYATIMEGQRWKTVTPLGLSHRAREETKIGDFYIPKGAIVISNAWALHNDPEYWPEPEKFEPERFILEGGSLNKKLESYIPFSLGRRNCPGESIAMMEIFMYLVGILQKYEILPLEDRLPVLEGKLGLTFSPHRQELRFIPRD